MKRLLTVAALSLAISAGLGAAAEAKGCIKGAIVGGLAGHAVGHGFIGAAGGCIAGRHYANKKAKADQQQPQPSAH